MNDRVQIPPFHNLQRINGSSQQSLTTANITKRDNQTLYDSMKVLITNNEIYQKEKKRRRREKRPDPNLNKPLEGITIHRKCKEKRGYVKPHHGDIFIKKATVGNCTGETTQFNRK